MLARSLWERACPANTGEARAMHRVVCFAGMPAPTDNAQAVQNCAASSP
ncbi:diguanylate cyclase [Pseudomonas putida]|nr:diguanylate cyclase [Pseudomonas putida]NTZ00096.1 diguanylate cyclase [Pseudomonas putida]NTZ22361.1 diguanylate cyclase [Pseudomonas putida]NTZ57926.1 diguanylate cyclase [Pseudomonas putida]NTZ66607.1 diguanylate cyclase [Pseudomonas putida]